jgi:hypothetical protein
MSGLGERISLQRQCTDVVMGLIWKLGFGKVLSGVIFS